MSFDFKNKIKLRGYCEKSQRGKGGSNDKKSD